MDTTIYLDFDLCVSPFSFDAEADASEEGAIMRTIAATYNHKGDETGQLEDYKKVWAYYQLKVKPFLTFFHSRIIVLTANSAGNVRAILLHFAKQQIGVDKANTPILVVPKKDRDWITRLRIVSTFDDKGRAANMDPNLFGAVRKKIKNDQKKPEKQKELKQIAKQFRVTVKAILNAEKEMSIDTFNVDGTTTAIPVRANQIEDEVTKAAYIKRRGRPFIFLDDSKSEIRTVQALIDDDGMIGRALTIPRPDHNAPFEQCGMFGEPALKKFIRVSLEVAKNPEHKVWSSFMGELIADISRQIQTRHYKRRKTRAGGDSAVESAHFVQHVPTSFNF